MTTPPTSEDRDLLEEQVEHLLASLEDLEAEFAAGDLDRADYEALKDDYTARAADALRRLEGGVPFGAAADVESDGGAGTGQVGGGARPSAPAAAGAARGRGRRAATLLFGVVAFAAIAGVALASAVGQRGAGTITGNDGSPDERLATCVPLVRESPDDALSCLNDVLEKAPDNVAALAYAGRSLGSLGRRTEALQRLDRALAVDPKHAQALIFRASIRADEQDFPGALTDLSAFYATKPSQDQTAIVTQTGLNRRIFLGVLQPALVPCWTALLDANPDASANYSIASIDAFVACLDPIVAGDPSNGTALAHRAFARLVRLDLESTGPGADAVEAAAVADVNAAIRATPTDPDVILVAAVLAAPVQPEVALIGLDRLARDGKRPPLALFGLDPDAVRTLAMQARQMRAGVSGPSGASAPAAPSGAGG